MTKPPRKPPNERQSWGDSQVGGHVPVPGAGAPQLPGDRSSSALGPSRPHCRYLFIRQRICVLPNKLVNVNMWFLLGSMSCSSKGSNRKMGWWEAPIHSHRYLKCGRSYGVPTNSEQTMSELDCRPPSPCPELGSGQSEGNPTHWVSEESKPKQCSPYPLPGAGDNAGPLSLFLWLCVLE